MREKDQSVSFTPVTESLPIKDQKMMFVFARACVCSVPLLEFVERYGAALQWPAHLLSHVRLHFVSKLTEPFVQLKLLLQQKKTQHVCGGSHCLSAFMKPPSDIYALSAQDGVQLHAAAKKIQCAN